MATQAATVPVPIGRRLRRELRFRRRRLGHLFSEFAILSRLAGARAVAALSSKILVGTPENISVSLPGIALPIVLRLRTSDARVCKEVLLDHEYSTAVNFSPRIIVDAGANCGLTSIFNANQFPDARIWAIEPEPSNYAALLANVRNYANIAAIQAALWGDNGEAKVFAPWPKLRRESGFAVKSGRGCRAVTVPALMREIGVDSIDILKVDIEGAERNVSLRLASQSGAACHLTARLGVSRMRGHRRFRS
jgi:FkbM family methyltransferase